MSLHQNISVGLLIPVSIAFAPIIVVASYRVAVQQHDPEKNFLTAKLPQKPLNIHTNCSKLTGVHTDARGFVVEKLVFESVPGVLVTAALFRPPGELGRGSMPALLHPAGVCVWWWC